MGSGCSTISTPNPLVSIKISSLSNSFINSIPNFTITPILTNLKNTSMSLNSTKVDSIQEMQISKEPIFDFHNIDPNLLHKLIYDALIWSSLHGFVVGDRAMERSGSVPGVGMVHAPFSLLPMAFPESHWRQACELSPIFNELFDRVSLDSKFLQDSLSRTKKADEFTSRLLDIHSKMIDINKTDEIRLGLHRSDYMLDPKTKLLLQIEFNTIASSFAGLSGLVSELHRNLLKYYGSSLGLHFESVPENKATVQFAKALGEAWREYNNPRAVVLVVVQSGERNMYDQHWLSVILKEKHGVASIRKTMAEIDSEGEITDGGTLSVGGDAVAVVYFRAGYTPIDYPSESEWRARLLIEQSSAVKCPSIAYHLAGSKKIQQELAKPNILERFLDDKEEIAKLRKCFAGLWSLDDSETVSDALQRPDLYVMKPQREGGGNNIYGSDVRETLQRIQNGGKEEEEAAYILMQRIFPSVFPALLVREGICHKYHAISELGMYSVYLRTKEKIIMNEHCGYLMRTKVASSDEGGVAAGFAVLDSLYLT